MLIVALVLIDQILKYFIKEKMMQKVLIPGFLSIFYTRNTGTVFGAIPNSNTLWIIVATLMLIAILCIIIRKQKKQKYGLKLKMWKIIFAGGISNLFDRIYRGFVIDYISIKYIGVCNLADFCIVIGVVILIIEEIKEVFNEDERN